MEAGLFDFAAMWTQQQIPCGNDSKKSKDRRYWLPCVGLAGPIVFEEQH